MLIDKLFQLSTNNKFSIRKNKKLTDTSILIDGSLIVTKQGFTEVYNIGNFGYYMDKDIIVELTKELYKMTRVNITDVKFSIDVSRAFIDVNTPQFNNRKNKALLDYSKTKKTFENLDEEFQEHGIYEKKGNRILSFSRDDVLKAKAESDSYSGIFNHIRSGSGTLFGATLFVYITYASKEDYDNSNLVVKNIINDLIYNTESNNKSIFKKNIHKITSKLDKTLLSYSPTTHRDSIVNYSEILCTEKNMTKLLALQSNGIANNNGLILGIDYFNNTPVIIDPKQTAESSNSLVLAESGSGKSFVCYNKTMQMISDNYKVVYLDIKGEEVSRCLSTCISNMITIDFKQKLDVKGNLLNDSKIINTLVLDHLFPTYTKEDSTDLTATMLLILLGHDSSFKQSSVTYTDLHTILKDSIKSYYIETKIDEDINNSKTMTYHGIIDHLANQIKHKERGEEPVYRKLSVSLKKALDNGSFKDKNNTISIPDLVTYDLVIFDFGRKDSIIEDNNFNVKIFMSMVVTRLLTAYNKRQKLYTHFMAEEVQQIYKNEQITKYLAEFASGLRSENFSMTIITNSISVFNQKNMQVVAANIKNFILGQMSEDSLKIFKNHFNFKEVDKYNNMLTDKDFNFEFGFILNVQNNVNPFTTIFRTELPEVVTKRFATRDKRTNVEKEDQR